MNIAILYGGPTSEREVSIDTKDFFCEFYKEYNPLIIEWLKNFNFIVNNKELTQEEVIKLLKDKNYIVIIASHGEYVEDGYIQEILEKNNIRFTGSDSKSCKLAMDKYKTQEAVKHLTNIIPTYKSYEKLEFPFVAKPNNLGSSVGVFLINNKEDLEKHKKEFNKHEYIFQKYIKGTELSLGSVRGRGGFIKLYPTEILPKNNFFDYESKYTKGKATEITPARISPKNTKTLRKMTNEIHNLLGLGYYSRSDFIIDSSGTIYYMETNTLPGMTQTSLIPQQLRHADKMEEFKKGLIRNVIG